MPGTLLVTWAKLNREKRHRAATLTKSEIPGEPGVYAWYLSGSPVYVGKAKSLKGRVGGNHLGRGVCFTGSAFRRNVAEFLGVAPSADIKARRYTISRQEADAVCAWIRRCEVTWVVCDSESDACEIEDALKAEFQPPLTKM